MAFLIPGRRGISACLARLLLLTVLLYVPLYPAAADSPAVSREYEIKAAFLYNFTKFIEWPRQSFLDPGAPLVIGVLGDSPCGPALEQLVKDHRVNGRAITVRKVESAQQASAAQLLFVGSGAEELFERMKTTIATTPVVTVGESRVFASEGGAIIFILEGDKVRFEINLHAADHAGVKISAQLLKLATAVHKE